MANGGVPGRLVFTDEDEDSTTSYEEIMSSSTPPKTAKKPQTPSASKTQVPSESESIESNTNKSKKPASSGVGSTRKRRSGKEGKVTDIKKKKKKMENNKERVAMDKKFRFTKEDKELLIEELEAYVKYQGAKIAREEYCLKMMKSRYSDDLC